jgi:Domain of unknown function (DUF4260)
MTCGAVRVWLRLEGLVALMVALWFYAQHSGGWTLFGVLFLLPDLSLAAYLAGPRAGARAYNLVHSYSLPLGLLLLGVTVASRLVPLALIWVAHISFDRLLGFGLQYPTGVGETHLGRIGRHRPIGHPA